MVFHNLAWFMYFRSFALVFISLMRSSLNLLYMFTCISAYIMSKLQYLATILNWYYAVKSPLHIPVVTTGYVNYVKGIIRSCLMVRGIQSPGRMLNHVYSV